MIYGGESGLRDLASTVRKTTDALRPYRRKFDSIVVTGMSGVAVGAPVALRLRKPLVIIRKPEDVKAESRHSYDGGIIGVGDLGKRALFLDDFISSGETFRRVQKAVEAQGAKIVGQIEYRDAYSIYTTTAEPEFFTT